MKFRMSMKVLKAVREEVARLGRKLRDAECSLGERSADALTLLKRLHQSADGRNHSQAAVLDFLKLKFSILLVRVVEVQRVEPAGDSEVYVTGGGVALDAPKVTAALEGANEDGDLDESLTWAFVEGIDWVEFAVVVTADSREGAEELRPKEPDNGQLCHAAVLELCLAVPAEGVKRRVFGFSTSEAKRIKSEVASKARVQFCGSIWQSR
mmetsp:Transcript_66603/g.134259  ORF Transcript_66603/g.134259 Transcript_66603/m.134259 type:complete len:210 (+) Transcript_66603:173-802(+)